MIYTISKLWAIPVNRDTFLLRRHTYARGTDSCMYCLKGLSVLVPRSDPQRKEKGLVNLDTILGWGVWAQDYGYSSTLITYWGTGMY